MNKARRKSLKDIIERLEEVKSDLEELKNEEQEAYDNMPESLQESERGETMSGNVDIMEDAFSDLESVIENLEEIE